MSAGMRLSPNRLIKDPCLWVAGLLFAMTLMLVGWAESFPLSQLPPVGAALAAGSPLFWLGLCLGFFALPGLVLSTSSHHLHWLASVLFLLLLSSPHFLYLSYGSDAGTLSDIVRYLQQRPPSNPAVAIGEPSYLQWPLSLFYHRFLADLFHLDVYTAAQLGYLLIIASVSGGLFAFLSATSTLEKTAGSSGAFWGLVLYFGGFYWFFNWQAVPYTFALAFFFAALLLLRHRSWQRRLLLLIFFAAGMESHALFAIWLIAIALTLHLLPRRYHSDEISSNLLLLMIVAQIALLIYKNIRFFNYIALNLQGYYQALWQMAGTEQTVLRHARGMTASPTGTWGSILKLLSFLDLGFIAIAFLVSAVVLIIERRIATLPAASFASGVAHTLAGLKVAVLGSRPLQLLALLPAHAVASVVSRHSRPGRVVQLAALAGLLLLPAPILRAQQTARHYVEPADDLVRGYLVPKTHLLPPSTLVLSDGSLRLFDSAAPALQLANPFDLQYSSCRGLYLLLDGPSLRRYLADVAHLDRQPSAQLEPFFSPLALSTYYDNGRITLKSGDDCEQMQLDWIYLINRQVNDANPAH